MKVINKIAGFVFAWIPVTETQFLVVIVKNNDAHLIAAY